MARLAPTQAGVAVRAVTTRQEEMMMAGYHQMGTSFVGVAGFGRCLEQAMPSGMPRIERGSVDSSWVAQSPTAACWGWLRALGLARMRGGCQQWWPR